MTKQPMIGLASMGLFSKKVSRKAYACSRKPIKKQPYPLNQRGLRSIRLLCEYANPMGI